MRRLPPSRLIGATPTTPQLQPFLLPNSTPNHFQLSFQCYLSIFEPLSKKAQPFRTGIIKPRLPVCTQASYRVAEKGAVGIEL
jgi:hypothetical protein